MIHLLKIEKPARKNLAGRELTVPNAPLARPPVGGRVLLRALLREAAKDAYGTHGGHKASK